MSVAYDFMSEKIISHEGRRFEEGGVWYSEKETGLMAGVCERRYHSKGGK